MLLCILSGMLFIGATSFLFSNKISFSIDLLILASCLILFADSKLFRKSIEISKEQDRKYFLYSILISKACNELDWAGLFAYNSSLKNGSELMLEEEIGNLTNSLRCCPLQ